MKKLSLFTLIIIGVSFSLDHNEGLKKLSLVGRSISSIDDGLQNEVDSVCSQEAKILQLREDLDKLQKERARVQDILDEIPSEKPKKTKKSNRVKQNPIIVDFSSPAWGSVAPQYHMAAPISMSYSPFHQSSQKDNYQYLKLVMGQRLSFSLSENEYWHPEWNAQGQLTNPQYGFSSTWSELEKMYRNPIQNQQSQTPFFKF